VRSRRCRHWRHRRLRNDPIRSPSRPKTSTTATSPPVQMTGRRRMSSQRPFFLSTFFAAFRQQAQAQGPSLSTSSATVATAAQGQPNKPTSQNTSNGPSAPRAISTTAAVAAAAAAAQQQQHQHQQQASPSAAPSRSGVIGQLPIHSPRSHAHAHSHAHTHTHYHHGGIPIPIPQGGRGRRRGSDSSSEGFRDALGAEKLYIGGRTATGEEKFFKLGVVRRVRSGDRLSLDRLSL